METLCRVCGSQGNYDVFGKIPRFLNTDRRDLWQQPICKMISDVTGIAISKNDGLPERVCGLCISYLKHAVCFRNRAVQTRLSLVSAAFINMKDPMEDFGIVGDYDDEEQQVAEKRKTTVDSSPAATKRCHKLERFFDYEEKTFVEDDMTSFDGLDGIEVNHPEVFIERKCGFCLKRFMLEETYDDHLDDCIFRTLIEFIKDSNYILRLKDEVAISNHEFIRRMVFALQRVNKAIRGMQLPVGLLEERPPSPPQAPPPAPLPVAPSAKPSLTPKVNHFFQHHQMKYPPPPLPPQNQFQSVPRSPQGAMDGKVINSVNKGNVNFFMRPNSTGSSQKSGRKTPRTPKTPSPAGSSCGQIRRVVCKFCDKTFLTITHLDTHMIKEHTS